MEKALGQFVSMLLGSLEGQSLVVYLLICFIIFLKVTGYFAIRYLLKRITDLQEEQKEYQKMSKLLMKQTLMKQSGVIDLDV
jgi:hypothetical protein